MVTDQDIKRIAAEAGLDWRTVRRAQKGARVRSAATKKAIADACAKLGIVWTTDQEGATTNEDAD